MRPLPGRYPVHRGFEPHQSGGARFRAFVEIYSGASRPCAQAKAMKKQGELTVPGLVVMVIDDDLAVRKSLEFSLQIEGLTVRSYATGAELLSASDLDRCDCFVIDQ